MTINRSNIKLQVTRGNKMKMKKRKAGGSFPDVTGDGETTMKDVLVKRGVLEKKGDKFVVAKKQNGGGLKDDIKKIKSKKASDMKAPPSKKASEMPAPPSKRVGEINKRGAAKKPRDAFRKPLRKRKGGGMVYQLYGGSTKDFSDGNKFIQSFYDKGGK